MPTTSAIPRNATQDNAPRLLYDRREASRQLSISIRSIDYYLAAGKFKTDAYLEKWHCLW
jgi:hypothetical protein